MSECYYLIFLNGKAVPCPTDSFVVAGWSDTENADAGADVDNNVWIRISEVVRLLLALLWIIGIVEKVALASGAVPVNEVYTLNQAV